MKPLAAILLFISHAAFAQISIIHQSAAGMATDLAARVIAQQLEQELGQPVVVRPTPGADGLLALREAEKDPTSLTIFGPNHSYQLNNPAAAALIQRFTPVQPLFTYDMVLVVPASSGVTTFPEFRAWAKAKKLTFASVGASSTRTAQMLAEQLGVSIEPVQYRDRGQIVMDMANGLVDFSFFGVFNQQFMAGPTAGKIRVIASVDPQRSSYFPDAPSVAEFGIRPPNTFIWGALAVHNSMPTDLKLAVAAAAQRAMWSEKTNEFLRTTNQRRMNVPAADVTKRMAVEAELLK